MDRMSFLPDLWYVCPTRCLRRPVHGSVNQDVSAVPRDPASRLPGMALHLRSHPRLQHPEHWPGIHRPGHRNGHGHRGERLPPYVCPHSSLLPILPSNLYPATPADKHPGIERAPEARLVTDEIGAVVVPLAPSGSPSRRTPRVQRAALVVVTSVSFSAGPIHCFSAAFTSAYRPLAASAVAANAFARSPSAAAFPLFAGQMHAQLGTGGATSPLAGGVAATALFAVSRSFLHSSEFLVYELSAFSFVFHRIDACLRAKPWFASHSQT